MMVAALDALSRALGLLNPAPASLLGGLFPSLEKPAPRSASSNLAFAWLPAARVLLSLLMKTAAAWDAAGFFALLVYLSPGAPLSTFRTARVAAALAGQGMRKLVAATTTVAAAAAAPGEARRGAAARAVGVAGAAALLASAAAAGAAFLLQTLFAFSGQAVLAVAVSAALHLAA
jgi:hypothetical protein